MNIEYRICFGGESIVTVEKIRSAISGVFGTIMVSVRTNSQREDGFKN
jgi:hypothetical protein